MGRHLLPLDQATERLRPSRRRHVGVRPIGLSSIIGTESRGGDFDREFHALRPDVRERRRRVAEAFPEGDFSPVVAPSGLSPRFVELKASRSCRGEYA
jgi:hypothetical protein